MNTNFIVISLIFLTFIFFPINVSSQNIEPVKVVKMVDSMTEETSISVDRRMVLISEDGNSGFGLSPLISNDLEVSTIIVRFFGLGNCNEDDELVILFENDDRIIKTSWNSFGCDELSYFSVNNDDIEILGDQPIKRIRFRNGVSGESYTSDVTGVDVNYFVDVISSVEIGEFEEVEID